MKKIICYGDSNTYGYDPRDFGRYEPEHRWVDLLRKAGYVVVNAGVTGREIPTREVEYRDLSNLLQSNMDADILILALGVNDAYSIYAPSAQKIGLRWENLFKNVPELSHFIEQGKVIFLISPPIGNVGAYGGENNDQIENTLKGLSGEYKRIAKNLGIHFLDAESFGIQMAFDGVHFSEEGNVTFFKAIKDSIQKCTEG